LLASQVRSARPLDVVPETSFHELHADIVGWPKEREKQIELARLIAGRADLVLADPLPL